MSVLAGGLEPLPHNLNGVTLQNVVFADKRHLLALRLGDDYPVERVFVVHRQACGLRDILERDGQQLNTLADQNLRQQRAVLEGLKIRQLPQAAFEAQFPDGGDA